MADDPRNAAFDGRAPSDERYDARAELQATYRPTSTDMRQAAAIGQIVEGIRDNLEEQSLLAKARGADIMDFPGRARAAPAKGMRSVYLDDLQIFQQQDYFEKPSPVGYEGLRTMVEQTPILNAIVLTRVRQLQRFSQISEDGGPGFEIRHRDRKHQRSDDEEHACQMIGQFISNCGWEFDPRKRKRLRRDNFRSFLAKHYRDSLTMDAAPIETEMKRNAALGMDGFYAVDGSTIRLCTDEGYHGDDEIYALQVVQGRLTTAYTFDQLIYEVRNPRADVRLAGYGLGETELLIRIVTGFLNAMSYNINGFDKNSIPHGILQLNGEYGPDDKAAFRRYWNMTVKGINNKWSLPVLFNKEGQGEAKWTPLNVEFDEMYFSKWMTFLTSIACAIYGMAPDEINFESFSASKSALSGTDTTERLANSKDSGLYPDMAHLEAEFTDYIVSTFTDKLVFRWVGLKEEDAKWQQEQRKLSLRVDEMRAELGFEPFSKGQDSPIDLGAAPVNPSLIGPWMQAQTQAQGQGGDFGQVEGQQDFGHIGPEASQKPEDGGERLPNGDAETPGEPADADAEPDSGEPSGDFGKALSIYSVGE